MFGISYDDGCNPIGLIFDATGSLYGLTTSLGKYGDGIIFRLRRQSKNGKHWTYTNLYSFIGAPDGEEPTGYPTFDHRGNLYGVTQLGGTGSCYPGACGAVFEFTP